MEKERRPRKLLKFAKKIVKNRRDYQRKQAKESNSTKTRLNFTIDKAIAAQFKNFCKEEGFNMSAKIEKAIKDIITKDQYHP
ncbi:hypothetical protein CMO93_00130 [Candidatus Woesearchaeota archaeon]|nr:hypothetical protein [Candidatus Woesearchaeota archaeon]|tara:strand:+ start:676 stop:921 length:246 start_codon:yes stop_codon:yes gene_type:complete